MTNQFTEKREKEKRGGESAATGKTSVAKTSSHGPARVRIVQLSLMISLYSK